MGEVTYADGIAIGQLVFYVPALGVALFLLLRRTAFAWVFLTTFSILRIVGSILRLLTISNPDNNGIWTGALVCTVIGLSPLLMSTLSLVSRGLDVFLKPTLVLIIVVVVHAPALVAIVLSIIGATHASSAATITNEDDLKIGVCLYVPCLAALLLLVLGLYFKLQGSGQGERVLLLGLLAAQPFLWVRLIYALLVVFSHGGTFGIQNGSPTASLCMAVLEEVVVVAIYLAVGLALPKTIQNQPQRDVERGSRGEPEPKP